MLAVLLEASVGKDVSSCAMIENKDAYKSGDRIIPFLPIIAIMEYNLLVKRYKGFLKALQSA